MSEQSDQPSDPKPPAGGPKAGVGCAVLLGALFVVFLISSIFGSGDDGPDPSQEQREAKDVCETFVERQLKAPSTADFTGASASGAAGHYTVRGQVDSENSFGAMIRNSYVCEVRSAGGDNWNLINLDFSE
jgi:hypothetical protein